MKESIAQAFILNLIMFFFGILILLYFGSINYSKAYKSKNRIITVIEKYGVWDKNTKQEVEDNLVKTGYQTVLYTDADSDTKCKQFEDSGTLVFPVHKTSGGDHTADWVGGRRYDYCVVEYSAAKGKYYKVVVYMKFEIPIIGGFLSFPVMGETKVLYENIDG